MRFHRLVLLCACILSLALASGCSRPATPIEPASEMADPAAIRIGTLPVDDALPLWVALDEGLFEAAGIPAVEILVFDTVRERDAAFVAGEIDALVGDIVTAAGFEADGTPVTLGTVTLGATPGQRRAGVAVAAGSTIPDGAALAGVAVGTSVGTVEEYVLDGLMARSGVPADAVVTRLVEDAAARVEMLASGELAAAVLPEPYLSLAEAAGATVVADDAAGGTLHLTALVFSDEYLTAPGGIEAEFVLLEVWDEVVQIVNGNPERWREMLAERTRMPESVSAGYAINEYPAADAPDAAAIDATLAWMRSRGLPAADVTYRDLIIMTP